MTSTLTLKHLVLLGIGPSHLRLLQSLARQRPADLNVTLVSPHTRRIEPALLPAFVAGHHPLDACCAPLEPLIRASGARHLLAHPVALDAGEQTVTLSNGDALHYQVLGLDAEPVPDRERVEAAMPGAREHALFVHPLEAFVQLWPRLAAMARERALQVAVVGGDTRAAELALAAAHALSRPHGSRITLITGGGPPAAEAPPALQPHLAAAFRRLAVTVLRDHCTAFVPGEVHMGSGARLLCDAPILAIEDNRPRWLGGSGLALDADGRIERHPSGQSTSHPAVFAAAPHPDPAADAALANNLRAALYGQPLRELPRAPDAVRWIAADGRRALVASGPLSAAGRLVWAWKDRRDRQRLRDLSAP